MLTSQIIAETIKEHFPNAAMTVGESEVSLDLGFLTLALDLTPEGNLRIKLYAGEKVYVEQTREADARTLQFLRFGVSHLCLKAERILEDNLSVIRETLRRPKPKEWV